MFSTAKNYFFMNNTPISLQQRKNHLWTMYCIFIIGDLVALFFLNSFFSQKLLTNYVFLGFINIIGGLGAALYLIFHHQKFLKEAKLQPTIEKKIGKWFVAKMLLIQSFISLSISFFFIYQYFLNWYYLIPTILVLVASITVPLSWNNIPNILQFTREEYQEWQASN
jgi:hypothetical protein